MVDDVGEVVKEESARQTVILVFSVMGVIAAAYVTALSQDKDAYHMFKMRCALWAKRYAQKKVDRWQEIADRAATVYLREKADG